MPPTPFPRLEPCPQGAVCLQIREEIDHYGIRIYQFPECDSDEDEEFKLQDQALKVGLAPPAPSLEGQSPVAGRTRHPGVPAGLFGATQALQHGGAGTYLTTQTCHQDPTGELAAWWGGVWMGKPMPRPLLSHWGSPQLGLWNNLADIAEEDRWRDVGPGRWGSWQGPADAPLPLQESIPFAVIGSNTVVEAKGRRVRGRLYPWGIVEGNAGPCPAFGDRDTPGLGWAVAP